MQNPLKAAVPPEGEKSDSALLGHARPSAIALLLFVLNAILCFRLFRFEYLDQLQSIAGEFIALARYIQHHHPFYDWFPMWRAGLPFAYVYQPALHYTVAGIGSLFHTSPALAYHIVIAITYSLGAATCFVLAYSLSEDCEAALVAGLLFSLYSPSLLFLRDARIDAGGLWNARRLQALVVYGEGPNVTGLTLCMLALALLHYAVVRRTAISALAASLALAAVPATSWPATVALALGVLCYVGATRWSEIRAILPRLALIGVLGYAFAAPFALPSTIGTTFSNTNLMSEAPSSGAPFWVAAALLIVTAGVGRLALHWCRASLGLRFGVLYSIVVGGMVLAANWFEVRLISNPQRFHLAMEIGLVLTITFALRALAVRFPKIRWVVRLALLLFCLHQFVHYRDYARQIIRPVEMTQTLEYRVARWADENLGGERLATEGSVSFWLNVFTETPHLDGCCLQSNINPQVFIADYIIPTGYGSEAEAADYSLLWMKAFAVHAVAMGGPGTRDLYRPFHDFPYRFRGRLPLLWQSGDDFIYQVPQRAAGLARVVPRTDLVEVPPVNGIDVTELRSFVAALDNSNLPMLRTRWNGPNAASMSASLLPDQVISVAINFEPRWRATANGRQVPVRKDGLGLIVIEPNCSGACQVQLSWDSGWEPRMAAAVALLALLFGIIWVGADTRSKRLAP